MSKRWAWIRGGLRVSEWNEFLLGMLLVLVIFFGLLAYGLLTNH